MFFKNPQNQLFYKHKNSDNNNPSEFAIEILRKFQIFQTDDKNMVKIYAERVNGPKLFSKKLYNKKRQ